MQIEGPLGFVLSYLIATIGPGGELSLSLLRHTSEEAVHLWSTLQTSYQYAFYYNARIVRLDDDL